MGSVALPARAGPAAGLLLAPLAARRASGLHGGPCATPSKPGLFPMLCNRALARLLIFNQQTVKTRGKIGFKEKHEWLRERSALFLLWLHHAFGTMKMQLPGTC